jgi:hypothetical protein
MDYWLIKQSKSVASNSGVLGAANSAGGSPAEQRSELRDIRFLLSTRNREERPQCVLYVW